MLESPIRPAMRSPLQQALDRIGSAPAIWTPATLFAASEQGVWYDPSDFSTLFQDSAGTVPITAVGQPVGLMLDKSGRGNHATQATTASKPILQQDENGKYYLAFDGVDDSMATAAVDFTATDKVSAFTGVRKVSDSAIGILYELSANAANNPGTFWAIPSYTGSGSTSGALWQATSKGTLSSNAVTAASYPAPQTAVHSSLIAIGSDENILRINGTVAANSATDQGAGNYGNYPLYIGRRGGASIPFNGRIYQLIIRGALTDAAGITAAETFVNSKTAAY